MPNFLSDYTDLPFTPGTGQGASYAAQIAPPTPTPSPWYAPILPVGPVTYAPVTPEEWYRPSPVGPAPTPYPASPTRITAPIAGIANDVSRRVSSPGYYQGPQGLRSSVSRVGPNASVLKPSLVPGHLRYSDLGLGRRKRHYGR